jgi:hypothetical protein
MLSCQQTSLIVSQSYDRRLLWRERIGIRLHLMLCAACANFKRHMDFLRTALRSYAQQELQDNEQVRLSAEALERIARKIDLYQ